MNAKNLWEALSELSDKQFKVYMAIHKLGDNDTGYCFASDEYIGTKINKSRSRVNQSVKELIELNFLNILKLNQGTKVIERRLYTNDSYKNFIKDSKLKIIKTTYIKKIDKEGNEYIVYINEKTNTSAKNGAGTSAKNGTGTSADIGTVTSSKKKLPKNNNMIVKKPVLVAFENFFKEHMGINFTLTNQQAVEKLLEKKSEEEVKSFLINNYNTALANKKIDKNIKSVEGLFVFYLKEGKEIEKLLPEKRAYARGQKVNIDAIEQTKEAEKEKLNFDTKKEKLNNIYENLDNETKKKIDDEAYQVAVKEFGVVVAKTMTKTITKYKILEKYYLEA